VIDLSQLRLLVVRPTLQRLAAGAITPSLAAENLVLGTGLHESQYTYLAQVGGGPALGFWQMEPATFADCWANYIAFRTPLRMALVGLCGGSQPAAEDMVTNLALACAMCRVRYARSPQALPDAADAGALAAYWKLVYNTPAGAGVALQVIPAFQQAIAA
jgi:hypothetical protein